MLPKISLAALVIGLALAPDAMANTATATVSFSETVTSTTSFSNPTPGNLGTPYVGSANSGSGSSGSGSSSSGSGSSSSGSGSSSSGSGSIEYTHGVGSSGYSSASIGITTNAPTTLTISDPIRAGGNGPTQASSLKAILTTSRGIVYSPSYGSGTTLTVTSLDDAAANISFIVTYPTVVLPGTYTYTTTITAVGP